MVDLAQGLRVACAALLVAMAAACDTTAQFAASLPPAAGFRVDDGVLKLWTGTPCDGVIRLTLIFDTGTQQSAEKVWTAPKPGVPLERMELLRAAEASSPGTGDPLGSLQVQKPLPAEYDWTKAGAITFYVDGPMSFGATVDVAQVLRESAEHPPATFLFGRQGWMDESDVRRENRNSFLTVCTPDPN